MNPTLFLVFLSVCPEKVLEVAPALEQVRFENTVFLSGQGWFLVGQDYKLPLSPELARHYGARAAQVDGAEVCFVSKRLPAGVAVDALGNLGGRPLEAGNMDILVYIGKATTGFSQFLRLTHYVRPTVPAIDPGVVSHIHPLEPGTIMPGLPTTVYSPQGPFTRTLTEFYNMVGSEVSAGEVEVLVDGVKCVLRTLTPYTITFISPALEPGTEVLLEVRSPRGNPKVTLRVPAPPVQ
ncbi:MAG: hypothetical protein JNK33_01005 [Candidatus Doudnabacteria bacterium]|nr:hypothetical protein [Candidatus Doudnabacteria bacterium]